MTFEEIDELKGRKLDLLVYTEVLGLPAHEHRTSGCYFTEEIGLLGYNVVPSFADWDNARNVVERMSELGYEMSCRRGEKFYSVEFYIRWSFEPVCGYEFQSEEFGIAVSKAALSIILER